MSLIDNVAGANELAQLGYEQIAHRSRLHPSICKRIVQEALSKLAQHIAAPTCLQVGSALWQACLERRTKLVSALQQQWQDPQHPL